jgi:hypothetical protein
MWKDTLLVIFQKAVDQITGGAAMEVVYPRCSGLDVQKRFVVAYLSLIHNGERPKEIRQFSTMTSDLQVLKEWLKAAGVNSAVIVTRF